MDYPYRKKADLAADLGLSKSTVHIRAEEMAQSGRYGQYCIIRDGNIILINVLCFLDWLRYRRELLDSNLKKYVPAFEPIAVAKQMGWETPELKVWRGNK